MSTLNSRCMASATSFEYTKLKVVLLYALSTAAGECIA
jgi:hypothetical protein